MDIIRSYYSTLSSIAQEEAPVPPEYFYTNLMAPYQGDLDKTNHGIDQNSPPSSSSSSTFPFPGQLSNHTSRFQQILRHFFGDYFSEDADEEIAHDMAQRWVAFARTGNPNHEESEVAWIPWRFIPHSVDLNRSEQKNFEEYLPWDKDRKELFNVWRDVEDKIFQDLDADDNLRQEELELNIGEAFRKRALEVLNMVVVEDDYLRTELKRNKPPSGGVTGDNPLGALRLYLSRWNNTPSSSSEDSNYAMIQEIQRMAQDIGVLGRGLSGECDRLLGGSSNSHGYWEDDFFPQLIELQWPPEGRLIERDCTCDFWERIRYRY